MTSTTYNQLPLEQRSMKGPFIEYSLKAGVYAAIPGAAALGAKEYVLVPIGTTADGTINALTEEASKIKIPVVGQLVQPAHSQKWTDNMSDAGNSLIGYALLVGAAIGLVRNLPDLIRARREVQQYNVIAGLSQQIADLQEQVDALPAQLRSQGDAGIEGRIS